MKYLFIVSMAIFTFAVSCNKKDDKKGEVGKAGTAELDCKIKDKNNKTCLEKAVAQNQDTSGEPSASPTRTDGGDKETKTVLETIPSLDGFKKMSLILSKDTALVAEIRLSADNDNFFATKIVCASSMDKEKLKAVVEANPNKLEKIESQIFLFNNSSLVADLKINEDDNANLIKLYMLTCNSASSISASDYERKQSGAANELATKKLAVGQNAFEMVAQNEKPDAGTLISFECNDDDQILKDQVKKLGGKALNRIRLRKGSAALVFRAAEIKVGDKKLNDLGDEAQNRVKYSLISCEG